MTGSGWKSQFGRWSKIFVQQTTNESIGGSSLSCIELTDDYKRWADECSKLFGGMDILAVDALHGVDGKDYIIELNDTAIGILTQNWEEDTLSLCQLVIERMNQIYVYHQPVADQSTEGGVDQVSIQQRVDIPRVNKNIINQMEKNEIANNDHNKKEQKSVIEIAIKYSVWTLAVAVIVSEFFSTR